MKKLITALSFLPLIGSAIAVQFMPEKVPLHYDLSGNADRFGNRLELLMIPVMILLVMLVFIVMISRFEKKAAGASNDRERASAENNRRIAVGIAFAVLALLTGILAYTVIRILVKSGSGISQADFDDMKFTALLMSILFIVGGNLSSKTKPNSGIGLRLSWTEYNDVTWSKSNRFAGKTLCIAGVLGIVSTAFAKGIAVILLLLLYLIASVVISSVYAHKVYTEEKAKAKEEKQK